MRSRYLFAVLVLLHTGGLLSAPEYFSPFIAGSLYLPLTLLKIAGLPVYASAEAWGWSSPSVLGWAAISVIWGAIWWWVAKLATWAWRQKVASKPDDDGIHK